ncbi:hypothetical protein OIDMADRAFT_31670 [Oidiodendron maius Zn]|uniref:Uncharacterized protein n=1 Tax=Oidiodendron maius (strain Zn) TaxID=913774 RepID=A0A0C3H2Y1_OIDMZ|nr:hypothetical protein OIDMADRAFT_31670 [Oidiodendron maius Zn]
MEGWRWWSSPSYTPDGHAAAGQVRVKVKVMAAKQGARFPAGMCDCWQQRGQNARARIPGRAAGHQHQRQTASRQQRYSVSRAQRQKHQQQHDHHQQRKPYTVTDELQRINAGSDRGPQCGNRYFDAEILLAPLPAFGALYSSMPGSPTGDRLTRASALDRQIGLSLRLWASLEAAVEGHENAAIA